MTEQEQVADHRHQLQSAVRHLAYAAGQMAAEQPDDAERLMAQTDRMERALARTAPRA
ncbi:hypothetical protein ACFXAZ_38965 [Streptomyces sp. NPDC059477]|uniref:hypothetical protein n=1 Tax=Streptomyces sp. NPDC059477 TaxID=3346847 RepID=UPI00367F9A52